jgi:hypothetical protein
MQSFTFGSDSGMQAIVAAQKATGESYPMTLNSEDFKTVIYALRRAAYYSPLGADWERCSSLLSGIAETLGIELI